jgi:molecular chaperone DnaK (HSP70)
MISRQPYHGTHRKLVLAFDVGTTYSGISYSILDPGEVPEIKGVTRHDIVYPSTEPSSFSSRFPAQDHVGGDSKIPSILYYDQDGELRAVGAEALQESVIEQAEEEGWAKLEWFCCFLVSMLTCDNR